MRTGAHEAHACRQGRRIVKSGSEESARESPAPTLLLAERWSLLSSVPSGYMEPR